MTNLNLIKTVALTLCLISTVSSNVLAAKSKEKATKPNKLQQEIINSLIDHYQEKDISLDHVDIKRSKRERGATAINRVELSSDKPTENKDSAELKASSDILNMSVDNFKGIKNAKELITKGYEAYNQGHYEASMSLYQQASQIAPDNIDAKFGMAVVHQILGHFSEAKKIYMQILKKFPENKFALNNFLNILSIEAPDEALITLKKLEQAEPGLAIIPAQMAAIHHRQKNYKEAITYYKKAVRIEPKRIEYVYNMAILFEKINQPKDSIILYNRILQAIDAGYETSINLNDVNNRIKQLTTREIQNGA